jgi:hypothetical protein
MPGTGKGKEKVPDPSLKAYWPGVDRVHAGGMVRKTLLRPGSNSALFPSMGALACTAVAASVVKTLEIAAAAQSGVPTGITSAGTRRVFSVPSSFAGPVVLRLREADRAGKGPDRQCSAL